MNEIEEFPIDDTIEEFPIEDTGKKSLFPMTAVERGGYSPMDIATSTYQGIKRDISQIPASFVNQLLLNLPRTAVEKYGFEYPSEKGVTSPLLKTASYGAGILGGAKNPLFKTLSAGGKLLPMSLKSAGLSTLYGTENMFSPEEIIPKAVVGGLTPSVGKLVGKGINLAGKGLLNLSKTGRDYLYKKVAEPTSELINMNLKKNPEIGKSLGLKNETINAIKELGFERVSNPDLAKEIAEEAFQKATSVKTTIFGDKINVKNTLSKLNNLYSELKGTDRYQLGRIIKELKPLQPAPGGFYKNKLPTSTQLTRQFKGEKLTDIASEVRISKTAFSNLRKEISDLYGKGDYDDKIFDIIDTMYNDAESSGLKGIQKARKLFAEYKTISKVSKDAMKIEKIDATKLHNDLLKVAKEHEYFQPMIKKYSPYLGKEGAENLFKEAEDVRTGRIAKKALLGLGALAVPTIGGKILYDKVTRK